MDNVFVNGGCGMDIWLGEGSRLGRSVWIHLTRSWKASLIAQLVKNLSARPETACNAGDAGPMPRSGGSPGEEMATHSSILDWEVLCTEEPGRLQPMES